MSQDTDELIALMYADYISNFADTVVCLHKQTDVISKFCKSIIMRINLGKTKIVPFRNGGYLKRAKKMTFDSKPIAVVSCN